MKIVSWNVNGLRSISKKGFKDWIEKEKADIVCLQEIKAQEKDLNSDLIHLGRYESFFSFAAKRGYSGVAVYSVQKPLSVNNKLGLERFDGEGRILELEFPQFILINLYIPHGGRDKKNLIYKLKVYEKLTRYLNEHEFQKIILIGDFNIAHEDVDLARPGQNRNNIMFTLKERKQIELLLNMGFVDSYRKFHKEGGGYTWWPYMANARKRNIGWRIDYAFASKKLSSQVENSSIQPNIFGSDHAPIEIILGS